MAKKNWLKRVFDTLTDMKLDDDLKLRAQRGTMPRSVGGEDSPTKGYPSARAPVTLARRLYQPSVIGLEK